MFRIVEPSYFEKSYIKFFDSNEIVKFSRFKKRLKINPYIGDMIRVHFVREFKTSKGKRAYFIIFEDKNIILFVAISNKKNQRDVIKFIFENLSSYDVW